MPVTFTHFFVFSTLLVVGGQAAAKSAMTEPIVEEQAVEEVSFHFPDGVELPALIKAVAAWKQDRIFEFNPQETKGTIKIVAPAKITVEDAYAAFLASLNQLGYAATEVGNTIRIEKLEKGKKNTTKVFDEEYPLTADVITYLYPLKTADGEGLKRILANFTNAGTIQVSPKTNMLIFTDTGFHIDRLMKIIEVVDVDRQTTKVEVYPLSRFSPEAMVSYLQTMFTKSPGDKNYKDCTFLSDSLSRSVIIAAPAQKMDELLAFVKDIDSYEREGVEQASLHWCPLDFADAKTLAPLLESLKGSSKEGNNSVGPHKATARVVADEPSNSLFVLADQETFHSLRPVIAKLDKKRRQYGIELHIFSVNSSSSLAVGTSLLAGAAGNKMKGLIGWEGAQTAPLVLGSSAAGASGASQSQQAQAVGSTFAEGVTFSFLSGTQIEVPGLGSFTPAALLQALKTDSHTKTLSEPFLLTQDQKEATFTVGQQLFFTIQIAGGLGSTTTQPSVERQEVGLTLRVKPRGDAKGLYTQLEVEVEDVIVSSIFSNGYPQMGKKKAKQILEAKNGQMILMSGLRRSTITKVEKKIPGLSSIPIVGILARTSQEIQTEENLLLFMMVKPMDDTSEYAERYKEPLEKIKTQVNRSRSQS